MKTGILYTILFCVGSVGFVGWRVHAVRNVGTPHFEIVEDPSASHANGCESLLGVVGQELERNDAAPGSTLTVLVLGDQSTANEPWRLGSYPIPTLRKVLEGKSGKLRREQEILRDISDKCQHLGRTTISPIFEGVTQGVADLHARGCKATSHCGFFVDTDGEENAELSIRKMLEQNNSRKRISLPQVNNAGIDVVFCGYAVTNGRIYGTDEKGVRKFVTRDSARVRRIEEVWRSLFTEPETVRFAPYCPDSTELGAHLSPKTSSNEASRP